MSKYALAAFLVAQAVMLTFSGICTLWYSEDLMTILIHYVGEERALGADSVIITENGGKLLTNPEAMLYWTIPFLIAGLVQLSSAATLLAFAIGWARRLPANS